MGKTGRKQNIILAALMILLVLLCVSCGDTPSSSDRDPEPEEGEMKIYCTNSAYDGLHWENYKVTGEDKNSKVQKVFGLLGNTPKSALHKKVLPDEVSIISYYFGKDGQLIIDFSSEYMNMSGIQETLCRAAFVKTFCQIGGVDYLEFYVEGAPLMLSEKPVGLMTGSDFVNYDGNSSDIDEKMKFTLYLTDSEGKLLQEYITNFNIDGMKTLEEVALLNLIGWNEESTGFKSVINANTKINSIRTYDGVCYVDLSEDYLTKPQNKISDEVAVYSVVNTLCEIPGVTKVKITVSGSERKSYGKVSIEDFLSLKPELIAQEKAGENTGNN